MKIIVFLTISKITGERNGSGGHCQENSLVSTAAVNFDNGGHIYILKNPK